MRKPLSDKEVQEILDFTSQKYIHYYDVQLELVDHIGSQIEELIHQDPTLSFEKALHQVYRSFGIYGFTKIQEEKVIQMNRYWKRRTYQYMLSYFQLPKILLAALMSIIFFFLLSFLQIQHFWMQLVFVSILLLGPMLSIARYAQKWKKGEFSNGKRLLIIDSLYQNNIGILALIQLPFHVIINLGSTDTRSQLLLGLSSICLAVIYLITYVVLYVFPQWLYDDLKKDYYHLSDFSTYAQA